MDQLRIKDLEVYAYHGVFPAEKELGQRFVLDLWVDYEMTRAARTGDWKLRSIMESWRNS